MRLALVLAMLAACGNKPAADDSLATYLATVAAGDQAARTAAVASWRLSPDGWAAVTTDPYRGEYEYYRDFFEAHAAALVTQLGTGGPIATRVHLAGDPQLTMGQARARWAQPVQAPSEIATIGGAPLDVVFVRADGGWRAIAGIDMLIIERVSAHEVACANVMLNARTGQCVNAAWVVAEAALRKDVRRLQHACAQLASLCPADP